MQVYMEIVCLIVGPIYVSLPTLFTCFLGFDVPASSFIFIENVFYYSCFHCFFFLNGVNIFCTLRKYWCKLYYIMKSYNHTLIKICSSMKVSVLYIISIIYAFSDDVYFLFHLQHCRQFQCLSLCQPFSIPMLIIVYDIIIQWL